jgi:hypothetical protein
MTILDPTTQQLLDNLDVVAFYSAQIPAFKINGHVNAKVKCPFECGDGLSFSVDREKGLFLCHRCRVKGSPWGFLEQKGDDPIRIRETLLGFQRGGTAKGGGKKSGKEPLGPIVKTYDYVDERGELLFQVTRHEPKDFRQRRKGPDGKWISNITGVRRVLYGLPGLIEAVNAGWTIYIVEGEKDADAINLLDSGGEFFATTAPMGAMSKWLPDYTPFLADADVVIVADRDDKHDVGVQRALDVRFHVRTVAKSARIVNAKSGKDAFDHLAAGHTLAEFVPLPEPGVSDSTGEVIEPATFRNISNPEVLRVPWLIEGLIPAAGLTIVAAHYKTGKTFLMYRLILDALFGRLALGSFPIPRSLKIQLWQFEMPLDVNLRRFHKLALGMGIDPEHIYQAELNGQFQAYVQPELSLTDQDDLAIFHDRVAAFGPDLVVVDSLSEAFTEADFNATRDVRKMLREAFRPLVVAGRGVVAIHHKRKGPSGGKEDDGKGSILGSQAFGAAARTIYTLDRVRDDGPEVKGRFVVSLAPQGGWDLETKGSQFVIADNDAGTLTTVDPVKPKSRKTSKAITARTQAAIKFGEIVSSRRRIGRQSAIENVRLELKCGKTVAEDGLALAVERKWVELIKIEGTKANEKELRPGVNSDWDDAP